MSTTVKNKKISLTTAVIVCLNAMIGSGIFTAPAAMASNVGPAGIIAYIFVAFAVWCMASSIAQLAHLYPEEGSFYVYVKQWAGHNVGLFAITLYFIGVIVAMGLLTRVAGNYLQPFLPLYSEQTLGIIALWILIILNMFGVIFSQFGQYILIICTMFPLIATTILCFSHASTNNLIPFAPYGLTNILKATKLVVFSFFGFECATSLFAIVENPVKNVPRAVTYSISIISTLYILFIASIILSTPSSFFSSATLRIPDILSYTFPNYPWLITAIHCSILSAILGTIHSMIWSASSLFLLITTKIKNKSIKKVCKVDTKTSVLIVGFAIFLSNLLFKNLLLFFSLTSICIISCMLLSITALFFIEKKQATPSLIRTSISMITATIILLFALEGAYEAIVKIFSN